MTLEQLHEIEADHTACIETAREQFLTERGWINTSSGFWVKCSPMPVVTSAEMAVLIETDEIDERYTVDAECF